MGGLPNTLLIPQASSEADVQARTYYRCIIDPLEGVLEPLSV
jgi:hypothetical protein